MPATMWKATIRGLLARRFRLALTAAAVVLGVSFVTAAYVLTDTVRRSFDAVFDETLTGVDLQVQGTRSLGTGDPPRVPEETLGAVRRVAGVAHAEGYVTGYAQFVARDGDAIGGGGPPTLGASWVGQGPFRVVDDGVSRPPRRGGEVAVDAATARRHGFAVGDRVRVLLRGPAEEFRVVGLFGFGTRADFGAVTFAAFDLRTAQRAFQAPRSLDRIYVRRAPDVPVEALQARLQHALGERFDVLTAAEAADEVGAPLRDFLAYFRYVLLGFAAISVVVGAFVIFNTFTILVAQRTRELGLLRAMGASSRQVVGSVVGEAFVLGVCASAVGLVVGIALGAGLLELLRVVGLRLPDTSTVLLARTVVVSLAVGVVVTVAAALVPASRAARVTPVVAAGGLRASRPPSSRRRLAAGTAVTAVGAAVLAYGLARAGRVTGVVDEVQVVAVGASGVLAGVLMLLPVVARPLAGVVGWPLRALGVSGRLARANAMRNPRRTAVTASALVVGLALVGLAATFGESAKASLRRDAGAGLRADLVVKADGFAGFSFDVAERLEPLGALRAVVPMRIADGVVGGDVVTVAGMDPERLTRVVDLDVVDGGTRDLADDGVLVSERLARRHRLSPGDTAYVRFTRGVLALTVRGVYRNENFIGIFGHALPVVVATGTVDGAAGTGQDTAVLVEAGPDRERAERAVAQALGRDFPNLVVLERAEFLEEQQALVDRFLTALVALLALSAVVAVLGIVNTMVLSVFERTRELGLLRAVGLSPRAVRRMIRWEAVVIALLGAVVGVALGVLWGWVFVHALRDQGLTVFRVPTLQVLGFLAVALVAGVVAAVLPAWRAARLDVVEAIATE